MGVYCKKLFTIYVLRIFILGTGHGFTFVFNLINYLCRGLNSRVFFEKNIKVFGLQATLKIKYATLS